MPNKKDSSLQSAKFDTWKSFLLKLLEFSRQQVYLRVLSLDYIFESGNLFFVFAEFLLMLLHFVSHVVKCHLTYLFSKHKLMFRIMLRDYYEQFDFMIPST